MIGPLGVADLADVSNEVHGTDPDLDGNVIAGTSILNGCPLNSIGRVTVNNVPAGATVWVMAHIDFSWKGKNISLLSPNPMTRPVTYVPSSDITIYNQAAVQSASANPRRLCWVAARR